MGLEQIQLGPLPEKWAGKFRGERLLIVGSGRGVWDDVQSVSDDRDVMTVNDMVAYWPGRVRHAFSNDWTQLKHWIGGRRRAYEQQWGKDIVGHTIQAMAGWETCGFVVWPFNGSGSSGAGASLAGLGLGYEDILLAGVPLDDSGHFYDPPWIRSNFLKEAQERYWLGLRDNVFEGRVKSMSGRSRDWLGGPT